MINLRRICFRWNSSCMKKLCTIPHAADVVINKDVSLKMENNLKYLKAQTYTVKIEVAHPRDNKRIIELLHKSFCVYDPLMKSLGIPREALNDLDQYFINSLKEGLSIKAVNSQNPREILGVCINARNCKWNPTTILNNAKNIDNLRIKTLLHIWAIMSREPNLHDKFSQKKIFELDTLCVHPNAQLQGLGQKLVNSSIAFAKDLGFNYARIDCTSKYSAKCAKNCGMDLVWEVPYDHLIDVKKQPIVTPEQPHTHIQVYAVNLRRLAHRFHLPAMNYTHAHHLHQLTTY